MTTETATLAHIVLVRTRRPHPTKVGGEAGYAALYVYDDGSTREEGFVPAARPVAGCAGDPHPDEARAAAAALGFALGRFYGNTGWLLTETLEPPTHATLHALLAELGWQREARPSGTVLYYLTDGPVDRCITTIPDDPTGARCATRGDGAVQCDLAEAMRWARAASEV